jgi:hypothetical protein
MLEATAMGSCGGYAKEIIVLEEIIAAFSLWWCTEGGFHESADSVWV